MIVGIVLGVFGILVSIFALKCIRIGSMEDSAKAKMTLTSGILFIISGKHGFPPSNALLGMSRQNHSG
jgi:claudin